MNDPTAMAAHTTPEQDEAIAELEAARDAARAAPDPNGPDAEAEIDGLPNIGPADISQLELVGFGQARQTIIGIAISAQDINADVFAATLELGGRMLAREKLVGTPVEQLDSIETDLAVMRAVDKFRKAIKDIVERQAARAALRVPQPSPDELLAAAAAATPAVGQ